jgi:hypothetical protein
MAAMSRIAVTFRAVLLAGAFTLLAGAPAAAHGTAQTPASDYEVDVSPLDARLDGITVDIDDDGSRLVLRNGTDREVTVEGYSGEPYLRIGPDGVFRNEVSPATFWNQRESTDVAPPPEYDAEAEPRWERIAQEPVATWHDHRPHYMGAAPEGGGAQVVKRWDVPLRLAGEDGTVVVSGLIRYLPPPSPWPYVIGAVLLAGAVVTAGRTRRWPVALAGALALTVVAAALQLAGEWGAVDASAGSRVGEHVYVFAGIVLGLAAIAWMVRKRSTPYDATPLALLAGVALALASGLTGLPFLAHAVIPTTLAAPLARVLVAVCLGAGVATIVVAAMRLRGPEPATAFGAPAMTDHDSTARWPAQRSEQGHSPASERPRAGYRTPPQPEVAAGDPAPGPQ